MTGPSAQAVGNPPGTLAGPGQNVMSVYLKAGETFTASGNIGTVTSPAGVVGSGPGSYGPATADGVWTVDLPSRGSTGYSWRITVRGPGGAELTGRVWTDGAYRMQQTGSNLVDLSFWVVNNTGYVYRVDLDDYNGINSTIQANAVGVTDANCAPVYRSVDGNFSADPACGDLFRTFLESPSADLPEYATSPSGTVPVLPDVLDETDLAVDDLTFTPVAPGSRVGGFTYSIDPRFVGGYWLEIDADGDGDYDGSTDRRIQLGADGSGDYSYDFDGLDGAGRPIPPCAPINARIRFDKIGEVHLLQGDVEGRQGGISLTRLNGPGAPDSLVYWDDTNLTTAGRSTVTPQRDGTGGVDSADGVHGWGFGGSNPWGNNRTIDDWTYRSLNFGTGEIAVADPCLRIEKTSSATAEARVGDTVTYEITATNIGSSAYTNANPASLKDDLSAVLDDATYNDDATASAGTVSYAEPKLAWSGPLDVGDSVTITYTVTLNRYGDQHVDNLAYQTGCDANEPACDPPTPEECENGLDPQTGLACDAEEYDLPHLSLVKTSPDIDDARPGDTIHYEVTVTNDGEAPFTPARPAGFIDDLDEVLDDVTYNNDESATTGQVTFRDPRLTWTGALSVGESATITYSVVYTGDGNNQVDNVAFEPPCDPRDAGCDPPPPPCTMSGSGNDPSTGLAVDCIRWPQPNLELDKTSPNLTSARIGDPVTYVVTATNTGPGDFTAQNPAILLDDLSGILDDGTYNDDASAPSGEVSYERPRIQWVGPLASGESVKITYTVTLTDGGDRQVKNIAFGARCDANDPDCEDPPTPRCPPEGKNPDAHLWVTCLEEKLPELEIDKTSPDLSSARIGDTVHYRVTLTNVGPGDFTTDRPARAVDDLTGVLDDATYNDDAAASFGSLAYATPRLIWTGELVAGESVTITYSVTLTGAGDLSVTNVAFEPPCNPETDSCDPVTPDCPDQAEAAREGLAVDCVAEKLPALEIEKTSPNVASARVGDTVDYQVTLTNVGPGDFTAQRLARTIDDLSAVLDDATYNGDATASSGDISYSQPRLVWTGELAAGEAVTITYSVTLTGAGDLILENAAFEPPCDPTAAGCDPPPPACPSADTTRATALGVDCVIEELPKLAIGKSSPNVSSAGIGDAVRYEVTLTNTGPGDFTAERLAWAIDDLTHVLDDATYNDDATAPSGDISYTHPRIVWTGELKSGESVTLTYSVTLTGAGDRMVENVAFEPPCDPTSNNCDPLTPDCEDGIDPQTGKACDEVNEEIPGNDDNPPDDTSPAGDDGLPDAGVSLSGGVIVAGLLLALFGTGLWLLARRRGQM